MLEQFKRGLILTAKNLLASMLFIGGLFLAVLPTVLVLETGVWMYLLMYTPLVICIIYKIGED